MLNSHDKLRKHYLLGDSNTKVTVSVLSGHLMVTESSFPAHLSTLDML